MKAEELLSKKFAAFQSVMDAVKKKGGKSKGKGKRKGKKGSKK